MVLLDQGETWCGERTGEPSVGSLGINKRVAGRAQESPFSKKGLLKEIHMIPQPIHHYLKHHNVPFTERAHRRAVGSQRFAQALHVPGTRVAKSVIVDADGNTWMAVLPASARLDEKKLAAALDAKKVTVLPESKLSECFPDCELGAEPPFGHLYHLPVVVDAALASEKSVVVPAGSHEDSLELSFDDYARMEQPRVADFAIH